MAKKDSYDASSIQVLEGLEAVRMRPGMYIGSTGRKGLNHLIYEIVDNSVDEHLAGYCTKIRVVLEADGSCTVTDDGRVLGTLEDVMETGANDVYVVNGGGREILLPAIRECILKVDLEAGEMLVHLLPGLL